MEACTARKGSGTPTRGYRWADATPGNAIALRHGAYSEKRIGPRAAEIESAARADPGWPEYLNRAEYGPAVAAWARAEAICSLLVDYLSGMDIADALSELHSEDETITKSRGKVRRVSSARRTMSGLELLRRYESVALHLRDRLGLSPLAKARIGRDATAAQVDLARLWANAEPNPVEEGTVS